MTTAHTPEYLRKRTIVRRWFWTPIVLAEFAWIGWMIITY